LILLNRGFVRYFRQFSENYEGEYKVNVIRKEKAGNFQDKNKNVHLIVHFQALTTSQNRQKSKTSNFSAHFLQNQQVIFRCEKEKKYFHLTKTIR